MAIPGVEAGHRARRRRGSFAAARWSASIVASASLLAPRLSCSRSELQVEVNLQRIGLDGLLLIALARRFRSGLTWPAVPRRILTRLTW